MPNEKLRQQILYESARMLLHQQESNFHHARIRAARKLSKGWVKPRDMPSEQEIRIELHRMQGFSRPVEGDRFEFFRSLLVPLAQVFGGVAEHPEGDLLYHSLQVFDLARDAQPYDEEFLLAALLHDVGKGIDPLKPIEAGLKALGDRISTRTGWLIENCADAHRLRDGSIGVRARRRLQQSDDYQDVLLLAECDRKGRRPGIDVTTLDDALSFLREIGAEYDSPTEGEYNE